MLLPVVLSAACGLILSTGELARCVADAGGMACRQRMLVHVSLRTGEEAMIRVPSVKSADGEELKLDPPLEMRAVIFESSIELLLDPLRYFNSAPRETVRYKSIYSCGSNDMSFCCECSAMEILGVVSKRRRGNPDCRLSSSAETQHQMVMSPYWYIGSRITAHAHRVGVQVDLRGQVPGSIGVTTSQSKTVMQLPGSNNSAMLTLVSNDALDGTPLPSIGNILFQNGSTTLHLPEALVTVGGSECNKVGVSPDAFKRQGERCYAPIGTCLRGQLDDIILADRRPRPSHVLPDAPTALDVPVRLPVGARVELLFEMDAAALQFVAAVSPAKIVRITAETEGEHFSVPLTVVVENVGSLRAGYVVGVQSSDVVIRPATRSVTLEPGEAKEIAFEATSTVAQSGTEGRLVVTITDASGKEQDSRAQSLDLRGLIDKGNQAGGSFAGDGDVVKDAKPARLACVLELSCFDGMLEAFAALTALAVVAAAVKLGIAGSLLDSLVSCCKPRKKEDKPAKQADGVPEVGAPQYALPQHHAVPMPMQLPVQYPMQVPVAQPTWGALPPPQRLAPSIEAAPVASARNGAGHQAAPARSRGASRSRAPPAAAASQRSKAAPAASARGAGRSASPRRSSAGCSRRGKHAASQAQPQLGALASLTL